MDRSCNWLLFKDSPSLLKPNCQNHQIWISLTFYPSHSSNLSKKKILIKDICGWVEVSLKVLKILRLIVLKFPGPWYRGGNNYKLPQMGMAQFRRMVSSSFFVLPVPILIKLHSTDTQQQAPFMNCLMLKMLQFSGW